MRILGTIEHRDARIQVFQYGNRFSVKLEAGAYEQTYKFRESPLIQGFDDIRKIVDDTFIAHAFRLFDQMHALNGEGWQRFEAANLIAQGEAWEEII